MQFILVNTVKLNYYQFLRNRKLKRQHLFKIRFFCNIRAVFTVTFEELLNNSLKKINISVFLSEITFCFLYALINCT